MIIKTFQLEQLKKINSNFFLLYGENEGFKNKVISQISSLKPKENINKYDESYIINNFDNFISEIANKSFFEKEKIIIISRATDKIKKCLDTILDKKIDDIYLIINAGLLDKKSKLRSLFEKEKNLVCIPFYADDNQTLSRLANTFFKNKQLLISQETINLLVERCRGDRENLNNELSKIEMFAINKKKISSEEIFKLTNLAQNYSYSELVDSTLSKNLRKTINILNENNYTHEDCIAILRIMLSKLKRLIKLKESHSNISDVNTVISSYRPPIFWKEKEAVKIQMNNWSLKKLEELVIRSNDIELLIKKQTSNSLNFLYDFLLAEAKTNNLL